MPAEYAPSKLQSLVKFENSERGTTNLMKENPSEQILINPGTTMSPIVNPIVNPHQVPNQKKICKTDNDNVSVMMMCFIAMMTIMMMMMHRSCDDNRRCDNSRHLTLTI